VAIRGKIRKQKAKTIMSTQKVAIITGGAGGIGVATGIALRRDGWQVVLADVNAEGLEKAAKEVGEGTVTVVLDITSVPQIREKITLVAAQFGRLDCLVNNAGVFRLEPIYDVEEATYDWLMDINLKGAFFCLQAAAKEMKNYGNGGVIVNVASAAGRSGRPTQTIYGLSKAGMVHLTKSAAISLGEDGIRVCCVCPAAVDTEMMARNFAERRQTGGDKDVEAFMAKLLVKRLSRPDEIADLVAYLASEKAAYITGGSIDISGGLDMH
jgi:NAD(P)-dependent dehydrogenase (short-subunit alcohol dehydrogenase family)